jgi:hypothetical protein
VIAGDSLSLLRLSVGVAMSCGSILGGDGLEENDVLCVSGLLLQMGDNMRATADNAKKRISNGPNQPMPFFRGSPQWGHAAALVLTWLPHSPHLTSAMSDLQTDDAA